MMEQEYYLFLYFIKVKWVRKTRHLSAKNAVNYQKYEKTSPNGVVQCPKISIPLINNR